jgi:hypothetical protein
MRLRAQRRDERTDPGFQSLEAHRAVVRFAGFVIGAAGDEIIGRAGARLQPDIMIRVRHVPVERIRQRAARDLEGHGIGAIGTHLAMDRRKRIDRRIRGEDRVLGDHRAAAFDAQQ